jgi:hypothetical protein
LFDNDSDSDVGIDSNIEQEKEKNSIPLELKKRDEELTAVDGPVCKYMDKTKRE